MSDTKYSAENTITEDSPIIKREGILISPDVVAIYLNRLTTTISRLDASTRHLDEVLSVIFDLKQVKTSKILGTGTTALKKVSFTMKSKRTNDWESIYPDTDNFVVQDTDFATIDRSPVNLRTPPIYDEYTQRKLDEFIDTYEYDDAPRCNRQERSHSDITLGVVSCLYPIQRPFFIESDIAKAKAYLMDLNAAGSRDVTVTEDGTRNRVHFYNANFNAGATGPWKYVNIMTTETSHPELWLLPFTEAPRVGHLMLDLNHINPGFDERDTAAVNLWDREIFDGFVTDISVSATSEEFDSLSLELSDYISFLDDFKASNLKFSDSNATKIETRDGFLNPLFTNVQLDVNDSILFRNLLWLKLAKIRAQKDLRSIIDTVSRKGYGLDDRTKALLEVSQNYVNGSSFDSAFKDAFPTLLRLGSTSLDIPYRGISENPLFNRRIETRHYRTERYCAESQYVDRGVRACVRYATRQIYTHSTFHYDTQVRDKEVYDGFGVHATTDVTHLYDISKSDIEDRLRYILLCYSGGISELPYNLRAGSINVHVSDYWSLDLMGNFTLSKPREIRYG